MSASAESAQRLAGGRVLHERCYDDWYEAQFGKRPMNGPEGART